MRIGHAVLSNTFRHPALLAKSATVLDHVTGGRFVLGLGAGWFEGEHDPFGIHAAADRRARSTASRARCRVLTALFSDEARRAPGVSLATTRSTRSAARPTCRGRSRPGGPPICASAARSRAGIRLAARYAEGWLLPGTDAGRRRVLRAQAGRDRRGRSRPPAAIPPTSRSSPSCRAAPPRTRAVSRSKRLGPSSRRAPTRSSSACPRAWRPTASRSSPMRSPSHWRSARPPLRRSRDRGRGRRRRGGPPTRGRRRGRPPRLRRHRQRGDPGVADLAGGHRLVRRDLSGRRALPRLARRPARRHRDPSDGSTCTRPATSATGSTSRSCPRHDATASGRGCWSRLERWPATRARPGSRPRCRSGRRTAWRSSVATGSRSSSAPRWSSSTCGARADRPSTRPPGISFTTLAERPDLEDGVHAIAVEAYPDIPSVDEPMAVGTIEEFTARDVRRDGIPRGRVRHRRRRGHRRGRRMGVAAVRAGLDDHRLARHDRRRTGVARPGHRDGAQARDDRLGDRATGSRPSRPATTRTTPRCAP